MTQPTAVIGGAPKCGTSSLYRWLSDHPVVCAAKQKETRYLVDPDSPLRVRGRNFADGGISAYRDLFAHCAPPSSLVLEATPDYLYQRTAREVLRALRPVPMVIFLLRRPSARVYSHYQFARNNMAILPRDVTFADFVAAARRPDHPMLRGRRNLAHVLSYSRYVDHLEPWLADFRRDHILIYLLEEMSRDAPAFMASVAGDLGIDGAYYATYSFPRENETVEIRSAWLQRARASVGRRMADSRLKRGARSIVSSINRRQLRSELNDEDQAVLRILDEEFAPSTERLAALTGISVEAWA